tara:strand:- start:124 stop:558 length:435 start_codon:yes stop_codon:yes gene_type:complete
MSLPPLISQERFTNALVDGITISHKRSADLFGFGHRMIDWINDTPNDYWACWNPKDPDGVILDIRNVEIMHLKLTPGRVLFLKPSNGAAEDMPKEFGNGAIGIMLFCMMDNGEIDEVPLDEVPVEKPQLSPKADRKPPPDFDWI